MLCGYSSESQRHFAPKGCEPRATLGKACSDCGFRPSDFRPAPTPKGLPPPAQRAASHPGKRIRVAINPKGVAARAGARWSQPLWGWGRVGRFTQGSSPLATLGWRAQSLWDCRIPKSKPELLPKKIFHKIPCPSPLAMIIMQMTSLVSAQLSTRPIADGAILGRRTPVWQ